MIEYNKELATKITNEGRNYLIILNREMVLNDILNESE